MLVDASKLPQDTQIETDICIIGGGAAGITIARELSNQPYQVCLLESGKLNFDELTQSLYTGENSGVPYFPLDASRARYFGGSTNLWGGTSRPLDEIDFENRPWMPYSGWPFSKSELIPYYERAQKVCGLGPYKYDFADWEDDLKRLQRFNLPFDGDRLETYIFQVLPKTHLRFAEAYGAEIERSPNIDIYLDANVVEIETNDSARIVTRLCVSTLEGNKFWVAAKIFVLACGGIENARLLLVSNKTQTNGLGNQHDLVGRFFMEHPYVRSGKVTLTKPNALYPTGTTTKIQVQQNRIMAALALPKKVQEREQILNFAARLVPTSTEWLTALVRIKSGKWQEEKRDKRFHSLLDDLSKVVANFNKIIARSWAIRKVKKAPFPDRFFETHLIAEQAPNPDSRVMLIRERDRLGLNRVKLDWRLSPIDKYTLHRSQQIIGEELARAKLGKLELELDNSDLAWQGLMQRSQQVLEEALARCDSSQLEVVLHEDSYRHTIRGSYHHIGTTRMSNNPREGVVDEHCRVHDISNLYITGSSVFPTSGLSNPTLTIVAMALRLGDRIKELMSRGEATAGVKIASI